MPVNDCDPSTDFDYRFGHQKWFDIGCALFLFANSGDGVGFVFLGHMGGQLGTVVWITTRHG